MPKQSTLIDTKTRAILELDDVVVVLGNGASDHDEHNALPAYALREMPKKGTARCSVHVAKDDLFCIHVAYCGRSMPSANAGLFFEVLLEGSLVFWDFIRPEEVLGRISELEEGQEPTMGEREVDGHPVSDGKRIRRFCFSNRPTDEMNNKVLPKPRDVDKFGIIKVKVYWGFEDPELEEESVGRRTPDIDALLLLHLEPFDEALKQLIINHPFIATVKDAEHDPDASVRTGAIGRVYPLDGAKMLSFFFNYGEYASEVKGEGLQQDNKLDCNHTQKRPKVEDDIKPLLEDGRSSKKTMRASKK